MSSDCETLPLSIVYASEPSSKRSSTVRKVENVEGGRSSSQDVPAINKDESSCASTSPMSEDTSFESDLRDEEQSLSSRSDRSRSRNVSRWYGHQGKSAKSYEGTSGNSRHSRSDRTQRRSSAKSMKTGDEAVDPEYQTRRNKRLQAIRSRRQDREKSPITKDNEEPGDATAEPFDVRGNETLQQPIEKIPENEAATPPLPSVMEEGNPNEATALAVAAATGSPALSTNSDTDSCSKLQELRACKSKRETQSLHLMKDCSTHIADSSVGTSSVLPVSSNIDPTTLADHSKSVRGRHEGLIEPVVYDDIRNELLAAYELIEIQNKQLRQQNLQLKSTASTPSGSSSTDDSAQVAELQREINELQHERASREASLLHRLSNGAIAYKKTIDHWIRETNLWKDRFESSWDDHEAKISQLKAEKEKLRQRACDAENDLASFKSGTEDTMLELIRSKGRIFELEEKLQRLEQVPTSLRSLSASNNPSNDTIVSTIPSQPTLEGEADRPDGGALETAGAATVQSSSLSTGVKPATTQKGQRLGRFAMWR